MRGSILAPIFSTFIGLLLALFAAEIVVRKLELYKPQLPPWQDRPKTYFYHQDVATLQDQSHPIPKPAGNFRIAVIGDSFTFAPYLQADDTFSQRLERWLNLNKAQPKVEVINYGVPRYSTSHEVAVAKKAIEEGADLILLQITLNDPEIKPYRPTGLIQNDRFGQPLPDTWLFRHWKTLRMVAQRLENARSTQKYKDYFFKLWQDQDTLGQFEKSLGEISTVCKQSNTKLLATVFPLFGFPNDMKYPFHELHAKAGERLNALNIPYLDLFSAFEGIPLERLVVLPGRDRHPNEIANRITAEALYSWLEEGKYLPQSVFAKTRSANREGLKFEDNTKGLNLQIE